MTETKIQLGGLNLNLEVIIPGIIIASGLEVVGIDLSALKSTTFGVIQGGLLFTAIAYAIGLIVLLVSRLIIDASSEVWIRGVVLSVFTHSEIEELVARYKDNDGQLIEYDLKNEERSIRIGKNTRKWNVVYRSALRNSGGNEEIKKRRSQGRVIRSLLFPIALAMFALFDRYMSSGFAAFCGLAAAYLVVLILYAYAELMNFVEAVDMFAMRQFEKTLNIPLQPNTSNAGAAE